MSSDWDVMASKTDALRQVVVTHSFIFERNTDFSATQELYASELIRFEDLQQRLVTSGWPLYFGTHPAKNGAPQRSERHHGTASESVINKRESH